MMKSSTPAPPAITLSPEAHETIVKLLTILDAFNHRNKNQHRLSPWWSRFSILRRALRPLSNEAKSVPLAQAIRLRDYIIPRSYLSFTQLAADNQHAQLGLMLLVALAQVSTIINDIVPPTEGPARSSSSIKHQSRIESDPRSIILDKGVTVARAGILDSSTATRLPDDEKKGPSLVASSLPKKKTKKKKDKSGDELSSLFSSLT